MARIFISYRRDDSRLVTNRMYDRLAQAFGKKNVFKDVDDIPPGMDFRGVLRQATANCDIMLVVIGPQWLDIRDKAGNRRLDSPEDFVRLEVETGLQRDGTLVIPILVEQATMVAAQDLPDSLKELAYNNAFTVGDDPNFHRDMDSLIVQLRRGLANRQRHSSGWAWIAAIVLLLAVTIVALTTLPGLLADDPAAGAPDPTPTPDIATSIEAVLTSWAHETATQAVIDATATATLWTPAPTSTPTLSPEETAQTPVEREINGTTMVLVPAGCFDMGSTQEQVDAAVAVGLPRDLANRELPQHEQCFDEPFWIGKTEVTNAEYAEFIEAGGYNNPGYWTEVGWQERQSRNWTQPEYWDDSRFNAPDQPVVGVSWYEAIAYAIWRGMTLPTESQWEYAARGPDGPIYPWGNESDGNRLNFCDFNCDFDWRDADYDDGYRYTASVGLYPAGASWVGALDMAGNVWNWTLSEWRDYPYDTDDGRENINTNARRVLRGGSWYNYLYRARAVSRYEYDPALRYYAFGFRVCVPFDQSDS